MRCLFLRVGQKQRSDMAVAVFAFNSDEVPAPREVARGVLQYHWSDPNKPEIYMKPAWCAASALPCLAAARARPRCHLLSFLQRRSCCS